MPGTEGINCEADINECASAPCQNGGTCLQPQLNMYKCQCAPGFTGVNCEVSGGDPCVSLPCKNNGLCIVESSTTLRCICPPEYAGAFCEMTNEPCMNNDCVRNFASLNVNFYGLPYNFNFMSYQECLLKTWASLNPSSKSVKF